MTRRCSYNPTLKHILYIASVQLFIILYLLYRLSSLEFEGQICAREHRAEEVTLRSSTNQHRIAKAVLPEELFNPDYLPTEEECDQLYLGCDTDDFSKPIAVVRPFVYYNVPSILENLGYWEMNDLLPCNTPVEADLIFWFHRGLECNPSVIETVERMLREIPRARRCFRNVHFLSADIPKELDYYGDGTIMMFYRIFRHHFIKKTYSYIYYMEPDVLPVQANWLHAVWHHTRSYESFWQKGGLIRTKDFLSRGWGPDYHINGNAIYRVNDPCFENFLKRVQTKYPHKPFDMAIRAYRLDESRFVEQQRFMHKFIYSDILQNHGDGVSNFSRRAVSQMSPNCYFVHSKRSSPDEYQLHSAVATVKDNLTPFVDSCSLSTKSQSDWDLKLYTKSTKTYWEQTYKSQNKQEIS